jgi:hypothetical protein
MKRTKNKRGDLSFLTENTLGLIISVLCIIVLIIIAVVVYNLFSEKSELDKAESNFKMIKGEIELLRSSSESDTGQVIVYSPKNWILRSYSTGFPKSECYGMKSCFCTCKEIDCEKDQKVCEGFPYEIYINSSYTASNFYNYGPITFNMNTYPNTIAFLKPAEGIKIYKQGENITIEQVK